MKQLSSLIKRNTTLFFRDKGLFFTSLITPMILLVLYATFLGNVYRDATVQTIDAMNAALPVPIEIESRLIEGFVGGQLVSSILAVSCVTVSVSCNMLMVQDKITGANKDISISPLSPGILALSYYASTLISTFIICFTAMAVGLIYLGFVGFYLTVIDIFLIFIDVVILVMFGTAFSSVINFFICNVRTTAIKASDFLFTNLEHLVYEMYTPVKNHTAAMFLFASPITGNAPRAMNARLYAQRFTDVSAFNQLLYSKKIHIPASVLVNCKQLVRILCSSYHPINRSN